MQDDFYSFIVRIWFEAANNEEHATSWRGSIEQVGSQGRLYFQDLARMCLIIQDEAGIGAEASTEPSTAGTDDPRK